MQTVTVYNTDSIKARDILALSANDDVLTESVECVGKVYIEQCFFDMKRRFDRGLFDVELRIIGTVKDLFIEPYDNRQFPCGTKNISFMDAERVMINYQLTAAEMGTCFANGVNHPGFEPPANMKFNTMEIPMLIEYKGIYESPVCFARIIRPNEIQTSTKKCGYCGLFDLVAKHPDVVREEENGGIDINLTKSSPELRMATPTKEIVDQRINAADKMLDPENIKKQSDEDRSVAAVRETIEERMNTRPIQQKASDATVKIYHESVDEYTEQSENTDTTNVSDIGAEDVTVNAENVVPYTITPMNSALYSVLSQKVEQASKENMSRGTDITDDFDLDGDSQSDKSMSKSERDKKKQLDTARSVDIAEDNKALNIDPNADIAGQGAKVKRTSAHELLESLTSGHNSVDDQQFL